MVKTTHNKLNELNIRRKHIIALSNLAPSEALPSKEMGQYHKAETIRFDIEMAVSRLENRPNPDRERIVTSTHLSNVQHLIAELKQHALAVKLLDDIVDYLESRPQ